MTSRRCRPRFYRPRALNRRHIRYYVVFAPSEHAGVYMSWHQIAGLRGIQHESFDTPQAALASFEEFCEINHGNHEPPPCDDPFTAEAVREFLNNVGPDNCYHPPEPTSVTGGQGLGLSLNEPATPAPPYASAPPTPRQPQPIPFSHSSSSSSQPIPFSHPSSISSRSIPFSRSSTNSHQSRNTHLPSSSPSTSSATLHPSSVRHPASISSSPSTPSRPSPSSGRSHSPSKQPTRTLVGGAATARTRGTPAASTSTRAAGHTGASSVASPQTRTPPPSPPRSSVRLHPQQDQTAASSSRASSSRASSSRATSSLTSSSSDVASWVEATSQAMERLGLGGSEVVEEEGVADLVDDAHSYVVHAEDVVPMVFSSWPRAHRAMMHLRQSGHRNATLRSAANRAERLRILGEIV